MSFTHPGHSSSDPFCRSGIIRLTFLFVWVLSVPLVASSQESTGDGEQKPVGMEVEESLRPLFKGQAPTNLDQLESMQTHVKALADTVLKTTVGIQVGAAQGSGVLISRDGYILTAAHVSGRSGRTARVLLTDGSILPARTLGLNRALDAGLMKIISDDWESLDWPYAEMGDAETAKLGQWVLALGHPGGYQADRKPVVRFGRVIHRFDDVVTTDCTLIGGDSGGPLFSMDGKVVGIHSRIGQELIHNVHVPISAYHAGWDRMVAEEDWGQLPGSPYIGVRGSSDSEQAIVEEIVKGGPADRAGIQVKDVITKFGDSVIRNFDSLVASVGIHRPGERIKVTIERDGQEMELTLRIGRAGGNLPPESPESKPEDSRFPFWKTKPVIVDYTSWSSYIASFRPAGVHERNYSAVRNAFIPVVKKAGRCSVEIYDGRKALAFGTIVSTDGYVLTKASQILDEKVDFPLDCHLSNGKIVSAELVSHRPKLDLVMLKITTKKLKAVQWNTDVPAIGSWLVTPGLTDEPIAFGVVSVAPRAIKGGLLGVLLGESANGPYVERVFPNTAAQEAGLQRGDIIRQVNEVEIKDRDHLIKTVRQHLPGEKINLLVIRGDEELTIEPVLGRESDIAGTRAVEQQNLGGALSKRRSGFESVLQHDTILQPEQCGGPIVDTTGKTIGINIARASRVSSYALPASVIVPVIEEMKMPDANPAGETPEDTE